MTTRQRRELVNRLHQAAVRAEAARHAVEKGRDPTADLTEVQLLLTAALEMCGVQAELTLVELLERGAGATSAPLTHERSIT